MTVTGGIGAAEAAEPDAELIPVGTAAPSHRRRDTAWRWWPAGFGATSGLLLFWFARPALADDAYISMVYARNLAERGEWALLAGVPSNTATSPLNAVLLAVLTFLTGSALAAVAGLLAASLAVTATWLRDLGGPAAAVAGVTLLVGAPVLNSAVGLEVYLVAALAVGLVRYAASGRWVLAGVLAGLLVLARPDAGVLAAVALLVCAPRRAVPSGMVAAAVVAPWLACSWAVFGDLVPRTLAVKSVLAANRETALDGWAFYLATAPAASALAVVTLTVGIAALGAAVSTPQRAAAALGAGGLAHLTVVLALDTGAVYYYLAPATAALGLATVLVAARQPGWRVPVAVLVAAGLALVVLRGAPWDDGRAPFRNNYATTSEYSAAAASLPPGTVLSTATSEMRGLGEIGVLAFFAPEGTQVVEFLSDPGRTAPYVQQWQAENPALSWLYSNASPAPLPVTARLVIDPDPVGPWPATASDTERTIRVEQQPWR